MVDRPVDDPQDQPSPIFDGHVLGQIGLSYPEGRGSVELSGDPILRDPDGHLNLGVLGILLDLASSGAFPDGEMGPWVHADITVHRLRPPVGAVRAVSRELRRGKRTAVVELDVHDTAGTLVAASTQQVTFLGPPPEHDAEVAARRQAWQSMFDGTCRLSQPLPELLGIRADGKGSWHMAHGPDRGNGFGGLHGGVTTTYVDAAAAGAVAAARGGPARTVSAAVRYLRPAQHGPFTITPQILADEGGVAIVRTPILDAEGVVVTTADVHVA